MKTKPNGWEEELRGLQLRTLSANWKAGEMVFRLDDLNKLLSQAILSAEEKAREEAVIEMIDIVTMAFGKKHQNYKEFVKATKALSNTKTE